MTKRTKILAGAGVLVAMAAIAATQSGPNPDVFRVVPDTSGNYETSPKETESLRQAIVSTGSACDFVTRTFLQGKGSSQQFWNVACSNRNDTAEYVVTAGGKQTKVLDCSVMKRAGGAPCFKRLDAE
jgi:hypothetical protein